MLSNRCIRESAVQRCGFCWDIPFLVGCRTSNPGDGMLVESSRRGHVLSMPRRLAVVIQSMDSAFHLFENDPLVSILLGFCLNWGIGQPTTNVYCGYVKSHNPYRNLAPAASSDHKIQWSLHPSLPQLSFDINCSIHQVSCFSLSCVRWCCSQCSRKQGCINIGWQRFCRFCWPCTIACFLDVFQ